MTQDAKSIVARRVFLSLAEGETIPNAAAKLGVSGAKITAIVRGACIALEANDSQMSDYLASLDNLETSVSVRDQGGAKLANSDGSDACCPTPSSVRERRHHRFPAPPSHSQLDRDCRRIERSATQLSHYAEQELKRRRRRARFLPSDLLGDHAWEILLEIFCRHTLGKETSIKWATALTGAPPTTALRLVKRLQEAGLVERNPSKKDRRVVLLSLTRKGLASIGRALERYK